MLNRTRRPKNAHRLMLPAPRDGNRLSGRHQFLVILLVLALTPAILWGAQADRSKAPKGFSAAPAPVFIPMPKPGSKVPIGGGSYLIYGFDGKPRMDIMIMKVEIFDGNGRRDTSCQVKANADMPSMRGAHVIVERAFKLSRRGDYVAPIDIVMPGTWEIRLTVLKNGVVIYRGSYEFEV
ncbi:MAG: hypothetical protein PHY31_08490 [Smithellaceae bacterium]|nr:hypothetical protein [Smithellaceae bacterium]